MIKERRLCVRFMMSGSVIIQPDPEQFGTIDCELIDLGFEGVGLYSPKGLVVGNKVRFIIINRQLNVNLSGIGRVIFCNPIKYNNKDCFRIGIEFIDVDRQQVRAILMNIRENS